MLSFEMSEIIRGEPPSSWASCVCCDCLFIYFVNVVLYTKEYNTQICFSRWMFHIIFYFSIIIHFIQAKVKEKMRILVKAGMPLSVELGEKFLLHPLLLEPVALLNPSGWTVRKFTLSGLESLLTVFCNFLMPT